MSGRAGSIFELLQVVGRRRSIAPEAFRATLAGLVGVHVKVEPLNADAEHDGLIRADLQADVERILHEAGMGIDSQSALVASLPGTPVLHVDVLTMRLDGRYGYSVRLELWQAVRLARQPGLAALSLTWSAPHVVGTVAAERLGEVRDAVRSGVERFVDDWRAATTEGTA